MTIAVFANFEKNNALSATTEVCRILRDMNITIVADRQYAEQFSEMSSVRLCEKQDAAKMCDIMIAIGGDGTILRYAPYAAEFDKPLLGINTGRLGFMASLESNELYALSRLKSGEYEIIPRMMLDAEIVSENGDKKKYAALNDFVISNPYSRISDFEISINGRTVNSVRADGIVFSTPTGSTAYALSAGGPIIDPLVECIEFTPICPHVLSSRTILFSASHVLVASHKSNDGNVYFIADGKPHIHIGRNDKVVISRSEKNLKLIDIRGFSFYDAVNNKLMCPIK